MMKILQIGKFFPPYFYGGIETVTYNLHNALQYRQEVQCDFLGFLPTNHKSDIKVDDHIYLCKTDFNLFSTQFSRSFLKKYNEIKNNYEIIVVNLPNPIVNIVMLLLPPRKNTKIILYWHSDIVRQKKLLFFYKPFLILLIKKSSLVTAPTLIHLTKSDFSKYFQSKSYVLPFILNFETKHTDFKLTSEGKKIIFACGRLIYYKGFNVLIDAARFIHEDAVIYISGTGALKTSLEAQINRYGLQDKVKLLGTLSDEELIQNYKNCYLYCFPSINRGEMMGMVQYEALSYCKPIVSTNIPRSGAPTLNIDGVSGFRVEINDAKALAEKINLLLTDEKLYNAMCIGAKRLSCKYNDKNNIQLYLDCFESLVNK